MRRYIGAVVVVTVAIAVAAARPSAQQARGDVALRAAIETETVKGDLKGAIEQYKKLGQSADRSIAAKALLRMAECYQKLGDTQANDIYERLIREFADQLDVVSVAQSRRSTDRNSGMVSRRLWTIRPGVDSDFITGATISGDGRLLSYIDWGSGNLRVHDFVTGQDRLVTTNATNADPSRVPVWAEESTISRDSEQVAYAWFNGHDRYELRIASLEAGGSQPRRLFDNEDVQFVNPRDWSPDGQWIAVEITRRDHTEQMGLISVRDGSLRVLKSSEWSGATKIFFSPDGKFLGFDARQADSSPGAPRDVLVLAVDGSRQILAAGGPSNDTMMGWAADGTALLFASDRGGTVGLWRVPVVSDRIQGNAELIKSDISRLSLGVSRTGALYTAVPTGDRDVRLASVDFETGKLLAAPTRPVQIFIGTNTSPAWSPDGKYLAYRSNRPPPVRNDFLRIQLMETGQVRELQPKLAYFQNVRWSSDNRFVILGGKDLKGRMGQYRVDIETGDATPLAQPGQQSLDGTRTFARKNVAPDTVAFVERDLASGREREIIRKKSLGSMNVSPDEAFMATSYFDGKARGLLLIPVSGDEPRELFPLTAPDSLLWDMTWMPDSRGVLVNKYSDEKPGITELWLVPIEPNRQPRKIEIGSAQFQGKISVHPDGHHIAYVSGQQSSEAWVLENFLPAAGEKR